MAIPTQKQKKLLADLLDDFFHPGDLYSLRGSRKLLVYPPGKWDSVHGDSVPLQPGVPFMVCGKGRIEIFDGSLFGDLDQYCLPILTNHALYELRCTSVSHFVGDLDAIFRRMQ